MQTFHCGSVGQKNYSNSIYSEDSPCSKNGARAITYQNLHLCKQRKRPTKKVEFIFEKVLDFLSLLWYVVVLIEKEAQPMKSMINELWHGNIIPQEDSRNNSKEMKELLGYMARRHEY